MKKFYWILVAICFVGLILRILSLQWNVIDHGDINGDVTAAASFLTDGQLLVSHNPDLTSVPNFFPPGIGRNLLVAHPPIWALLGSGLLGILQFEPTFENAFFILKLLSVFSGILLILLSAVLARRIFTDKIALWIALWIALSYLMIDYSGNGALYSLQSVTYIVWILVAYSNVRHKAVALGLVSGIAYLVNHQSMVMAAASVVILLCTHTSWRQKIIDVLTVTFVTFMVTSPWLIRNYLVYGDLFFSHAVNSTYIYVKTALPREVINGREYFIVGFSGRLDIMQNIFTVWLPNNMYYIARKLFILAPVLFFFFSFAWVDYLFSPQRRKVMLPIIVLCVLHLLLSAAWPVTKFRYFVPLLPLVYFIAVDQIQHISLTQSMRNGVYALVTVCIVVLSYCTYLSVPTHTYYYDGAITNDPFHGRGEYEYMVRRGILPQ